MDWVAAYDIGGERLYRVRKPSLRTSDSGEELSIWEVVSEDDRILLFHDTAPNQTVPVARSAAINAALIVVSLYTRAAVLAEKIGDVTRVVATQCPDDDPDYLRLSELAVRKMSFEEGRSLMNTLTISPRNRERYEPLHYASQWAGNNRDLWHKLNEVMRKFKLDSILEDEIDFQFFSVPAPEEKTVALAREKRELCSVMSSYFRKGHCASPDTKLLEEEHSLWSSFITETLGNLPELFEQFQERKSVTISEVLGAYGISEDGLSDLVRQGVPLADILA